MTTWNIISLCASSVSLIACAVAQFYLHKCRQALNRSAQLRDQMCRSAASTKV